MIFEVFHPQVDPFNRLSMKFRKKKGSEGLLKLTKFGVAMLIFGDIWPQQNLDQQLKHGNLLHRRGFAAKKCPASDALASSECICVSTLCSQKSDAKIQITITTAYLIRIEYPLSGFNYHLSDVNVVNFNKIHGTVSEQQLF